MRTAVWRGELAGAPRMARGLLVASRGDDHDHERAIYTAMRATDQFMA